MKNQFWNIAGQYNNDTMMFQILIFACGLILTILLYKKPSKAICILQKLYLAFCFAWIAIAYFVMHGSADFNNMWNAVPFAVVSLLWLADVFLNKVSFMQNTKHNELSSLLYGIWFLFPVISIMIGRKYPEMSGLIFPCNLITYALIVMISYSEKTNRILLFILVALAVPGGIVNVFVFKVWEDVIMIVAGIAAMVVFAEPIIIRQRKNSDNMNKKYYLAYDERYRKVHERGLLWASQKPTPELLQWIEVNGIPKTDEILEVGCGEGRDALNLAERGYSVIAMDASKCAIEKCEELAENKGVHAEWIINDVLNADKFMDRHFKWIYSIGTLHMLVEDEDRTKFLSSLHNMLEPDGKLLLVNMGDGESERRTDKSNAFELQERNHMGTGEKIMVAGTSCRVVNWETHQKELMDAGFIIDKKMITENDEYASCMTVWLSRK